MCGGCLNESDENGEIRGSSIERTYLKPISSNQRLHCQEQQQQQESEQNFDDWIQSIEQSRIEWKYMKEYTIQNLIREGQTKFANQGQEPLTRQQAKELYDKWFGGDENFAVDQDEAITRLRDMFEAL